jgi:hypothetical protein
MVIAAAIPSYWGSIPESFSGVFPSHNGYGTADVDTQSCAPSCDAISAASEVTIRISASWWFALNPGPGFQ